MTTFSSPSARRSLAIASVIVGAVATLMLVAFWLISWAADGQGLSTAVVIAVVLFYAAVAVGVVAVIVGILATSLARPRFFGVIGIALGLVPIVLVIVSPSLQVG